MALPFTDVDRVVPPASSWEPFRWIIFAGMLVIALETALIFAMLAMLSGRRRAGLALAESKNRLTAILDTAIDAIVTIRDDGTIETVNAAAERMFAYTASQLMGRNVSLLIPGFFDAEPLTSLKKIPVARELSGRRETGSTIPLEVSVHETATTAEGRVFTCLARDVTERRQNEELTREFGRRLLEAQEAERARLARELHDDITQRLAHLAIEADFPSVRPHVAEPVEGMRRIREGLMLLTKDVHALAYQLHPALLKHVGLVDALKAECARFSEQKSITVVCTTSHASVEAPMETSLCLFRIAQEALRNAARHAHSQIVEVSLVCVNKGLQLTVADAGVGFELGKATALRGLGLTSMRERVRLLDGTLDIDTRPGAGTSLRAWVPRPELDNETRSRLAADNHQLQPENRRGGAKTTASS
jgi:PAS domain S-box-containing protein